MYILRWIALLTGAKGESATPIESKDAAARAAITDLTRQLANVARAKNGLYRESIEDVQSRNVQAALRLRLAREELEAAERVMNGKGKA